MRAGTWPLCDPPVADVDPDVAGRTIHRYSCLTYVTFLISPEAASYVRDNAAWCEGQRIDSDVRVARPRWLVRSSRANLVRSDRPTVAPAMPERTVHTRSMEWS